MKSLLEIKKQIHQADDLSNIITTMKNISTVNTTHYERKLRAVRQYFSTLEQGLQIFLQNDADHILEVLKEKNRTAPPSIAAIIIGSEKGLCGEFNEKIYSYFQEKTKNKQVFSTISVGYKISARLRNEQSEQFNYPASHEEILLLLRELISIVQEWLFEKKIGEVVFFHHHLLSGLRYEPISQTIFPLNLDWLKSLKQRPWPSHCLPIYKMDRETLFYELTQETLFISMYRSFIESLASENSGRLSSMQTAEEKIQNQLSELKQSYNLQRQNKLTEELSEIIASFEILKNARHNK